MIYPVAVEDGKEVDINRHKAATAPNLIHSLDASLLHLAVRSFDQPIALIHDSVLSRACDMGKLSAIIRETYMHLFAEHDYLKTFALYVGAETDPPIIGDFTTRNGYRIHLFFLLTMTIDIYKEAFYSPSSFFSSFFAPTEIYVVAKEDIEKAKHEQYHAQLKQSTKMTTYNSKG